MKKSYTKNLTLLSSVVEDFFKFCGLLRISELYRMVKLNSFYHNPKNMYGRSITNDDVAKGDKFYAGQHMDGKWYRVKVNASIDEGTVAAKIVDFGDFTMIPLESLQPLWPQFRNLPMQAISASLAGILFETIT